MFGSIGSCDGETLEDLATALLRSLFEAVAGEPPLTLRAYHDDDTLLLLLRFDPGLLEDATGMRFEPLIDVSLMAMPDLIADAVADQTVRRLVPGNLSVCAERGFAVLAFAVVGPDDAERAEAFPLVVAAGL